MHVHLRKLLEAQDECVAIWQLRAADFDARRAARMVRGMEKLHSGVYLSSLGGPTPHQRRRAATLTTPTTFLAGFSAAGGWEMRAYSGLIQSVVRPGTCGPRQGDRLAVTYSAALDGDVTTRNGIPITTPERTIIDFVPALDDWQQRKMLREALRLKTTTIPSLNAAVQKHHTRRGTAHLKRLITLYATLQLDRCKSDAEAYSMELLATARRTLPGVNEEVGGHEADLSWPAHNLIIEIDGPQFHRDKLADGHKTAAWVQAGWAVRRIPSDDIFADPDRLLALAPL